MKFTITQSELKKLSRCCANKIREMLQNVFITVKGAAVELAATDGCILAVTKKAAELGETPEGFKTLIPVKLCSKFNSKARLEISSTEQKNTYKARDLVSGAEIYYTAPENPARPNYEVILSELDQAKGAENYAVFMPEILKKIYDLILWYDFQRITPRTMGKNRVHFWVNDDYIIAAMPCRS